MKLPNVKKTETDLGKAEAEAVGEAMAYKILSDSLDDMVGP